MRTALIAEHLEQQVGCTVDDSGMVAKLARRAHVSTQVHQGGDVVDANRRIDRPDQIERRKPGLVAGLSDRHVSANHTRQRRAIRPPSRRTRDPQLVTVQPAWKVGALRGSSLGNT